MNMTASQKCQGHSLLFGCENGSASCHTAGQFLTYQVSHTYA